MYLGPHTVRALRAERLALRAAILDTARAIIYHDGSGTAYVPADGMDLAYYIVAPASGLTRPRRERHGAWRNRIILSGPWRGYSVHGRAYELATRAGRAHPSVSKGCY